MSKALGSIPILKEERKIGAGEVAQRIILMLLHIWGSSMRTRVQPSLDVTVLGRKTGPSWRLSG